MLATFTMPPKSHLVFQIKTYGIHIQIVPNKINREDEIYMRNNKKQQPLNLIFPIFLGFPIYFSGYNLDMVMVLFLC